MQKFAAYTVAFMLVILGGLSFYRAILSKDQLNKIEGKVLRKTIEVVSARSKGYALTFTLDNHTCKPGIYYGTEQQANNNNIVSLIDTGKTYTFLLDPTTPTNHQINLGIREIDFRNNIVYKESSVFNLATGSFCILFALSILYTAVRLNQRSRTDRSRTIP